MLDSASTLALVAAPAVGSFLGTLVLRLPAGQPVVAGRSACPHCHHVLAPSDMVPLFSWLLLRGRCRHCGAAIGAFYPAMEMVALGLAVAVVVLLPAVAVPWSCLLGWALLALALIDRRAFLLPDVLTLPLLLLGLAATAMLDPAALPAHLTGAGLGWMGFAALAAGYRALRGREGLGGGDAKLLAAGGAWLGWAALPAIMFGAALLGIVEVLLRKLNFPAQGRTVGAAAQPGQHTGADDALAGHAAPAGEGHAADQPIAFGTWLALAIWLLWLFGVPGT